VEYAIAAVVVDGDINPIPPLPAHYRHTDTDPRSQAHPPSGCIHTDTSTGTGTSTICARTRCFCMFGALSGNPYE